MVQLYVIVPVGGGYEGPVDPGYGRPGGGGGVDPGWGVRPPVDPGYGRPGWRPVDPSWGVRPPVDPGYGRPGWSPVDPGYGHPAWLRPDNSLPGSGARPDNSLPGGWGGRPDNSLPNAPVRPSHPIYWPEVPPGETKPPSEENLPPIVVWVPGIGYITAQPGVGVENPIAPTPEPK